MDEFNALLYGAPTREFVNYANNGMVNLMSTVNEKARGYFKEAGNFFSNKYTSNEAIDRIKDVYLRAGQTIGQDTITYMQDPRYSKPLMQRFIMSHPRYYKLAQDKHINGFNETITLDHREEPYENEDYNMVMDGWLTVDSKNEYPVEYITTEEALSTSEQIAIMDTWDECAIMMSEDIDPTEAMTN